jgi:hypothetical protein
VPTTDEAAIAEVPIDEVPEASSSENSSESLTSTEAADQALEDARINLGSLKYLEQRARDQAEAAGQYPTPKTAKVPLQQAPGLSQIPEENEPSSSQEGKTKPKSNSGREIKDSQESDSSLESGRTEAMTTERPEGRFGSRPDDAINTDPPAKTPSEDSDPKPEVVNPLEEAVPAETTFTKPSEEVAPLESAPPTESAARVESAPPVESPPTIEAASSAPANEEVPNPNSAEDSEIVGNVPAEQTGAEKKAQKKAEKKAEEQKREAEELKEIYAAIMSDPNLSGGQMIDAIRDATPRNYYYNPETSEVIYYPSSESSRSSQSPPRSPVPGSEAAEDGAVVEGAVVDEAVAEKAPVETNSTSPGNKPLKLSFGAPTANAEAIRQALRDQAKNRGESNEVAVQSDSISPLMLPRDIDATSSSGSPPADLLPGNEISLRRLSELATTAPQPRTEPMEVNSEEKMIPATSPDDSALMDRAFRGSRTESFHIISKPESTDLPASSLRKKPKAEAKKVQEPQH